MSIISLNAHFFPQQNMYKPPLQVAKNSLFNLNFERLRLFSCFELPPPPKKNGLGPFLGTFLSFLFFGGSVIDTDY